MDLHHPITREFPRHLETIKQLKNTSDPFRKAFNEYHRLDDAIFRVEEDVDFASDQEIQEMKLERARLKDWIYHAIHKCSRRPLRHTRGRCGPASSARARADQAHRRHQISPKHE